MQVGLIGVPFDGYGRDGLSVTIYDPDRTDAAAIVDLIGEIVCAIE